MIGRSLARLEPAPRKWVQRFWGFGDLDTRQKWTILWPWLERLPLRGLSVLDAGCGKGAWALELAARRPGWSITGIDIVPESVRAAESSRSKLCLPNVRFQVSDLSEFEGLEEFDTVLSVFSSHYLSVAGRGDELFRRIEGWLTPGGRLYLLAPRRLKETPFTELLPRKRWWDVYSHEELRRLCEESGLSIEHLSGRVGRVGALCKQATTMFTDGRRRLGWWALYPIVSAISSFGSNAIYEMRSRSVFLFLVARKPLDPSKETARPEAAEGFHD